MVTSSIKSLVEAIGRLRSDWSVELASVVRKKHAYAAGERGWWGGQNRLQPRFPWRNIAGDFARADSYGERRVTAGVMPTPAVRHKDAVMKISVAAAPNALRTACK
jgi:hypothetical protein